MVAYANNPILFGSPSRKSLPICLLPKTHAQCPVMRPRFARLNPSRILEAAPCSSFHFCLRNCSPKRYLMYPSRTSYIIPTYPCITSGNPTAEVWSKCWQHSPVQGVRQASRRGEIQIYFQRNAPHSVFWIAVEELKLSYHNMSM